MNYNTGLLYLYTQIQFNEEERTNTVAQTESNGSITII